jgi:predicted RND superfamily exporter protein
MGDKEVLYNVDEFENSKNKFDYKNYKELNTVSENFKNNKIEISNKYDYVSGLNFDFFNSTFYNTVSTTKTDILGKSDYNIPLLDFFENNQRWSHRQSLENNLNKVAIEYNNFNILDIRTFIKKNLGYSNLNFISLKIRKYSEVDDMFNYYWQNYGNIVKNEIIFVNYWLYCILKNFIKFMYLQFLIIYWVFLVHLETFWLHIFFYKNDEKNLLFSFYKSILWFDNILRGGYSGIKFKYYS